MSNAGPYTDAGVEVIWRDGDGDEVADTYTAGRAWDVHDGGHLTITDDAGKRLAAYVPLRWLSVRKLG